jgi:hypothetical protein
VAAGIYAKMFHVKHRPGRPHYAILQNNPMDRKIALSNQLLSVDNFVHSAAWIRPESAD